jgi:ribosomal protein S17E
MSEVKTVAELKIDQFADEIKSQFEEIGKDVKEQLMQDFDKILTNDLEGLKDILSKIVKEKTSDILSNSSSGLQSLVDKDFKGSIFGSILSNAIIPNIIGSDANSRDFKTSTSQKFL